MSGCYGTHPEDQYWERKLHEHLAEKKQDAPDDFPDEESELDFDDENLGDC